MKKIIIIIALLLMGCAASRPTVRQECLLLRLRTEHLIEYDQNLSLYMNQASQGLITPQQAVSYMHDAAIIFRMQCRADSMWIYRR